MKTVFADTVYWIAIADKDDQWHQIATVARSRLGKALLITTDEVLGEFLSFFREFSPSTRRTAAATVRQILTSPNVKVAPQTRASFLEGLSLYEKRLDKAYSYQDCISMALMKSRRLTEVLTNDHHFEQEGFITLMKREH